MRVYVFLLLILPVFIARSQSYTIETVPNVKLINNSHVSNPDRLLTDNAEAQINLLLDSLEKKTTAQVAIVMLKSIGDADVFEFAQSLFVKWGIGQSSNDNGLLILYVEDKRTVRFHTGYGLEGVLPDAICKRIQTQKMVPRFKEGNTDAGMIAGIEEVVRIISSPNAAEVASEEHTDDVNLSDEGAISFLAAFAWLIGGPIYYFTQRKSGFANSKNFTADGPTSTIKKGNWWIWYYLFPLILLLIITYVNNHWIFFGSIYGFMLLLATGKYFRMIQSANAWLKKGEFRTVYDFYEKNNEVIGLAFLFPIPFAFLISNFKKRKLRVRHYPRPCNKCNQVIAAPLTEAQEDEFLSEETLFEENLQSVDYDVWKCAHCDDFHYEMYINPKTKFTECLKCNTYALHTISSSTKVSATTSRSGTREIVKECKYCHKKTIVEETIPQISTSSSSDSSSSSSSSSGSSWGGGSSGGGGASSSW